MVLQLMKIGIRTRLHRFPFKKISGSVQNSKKLLVKKRKLHLQEIIALEDTIYDLYLHVEKLLLILFLPKTTLELLKKF
jgi:hypothetical protein